MESKECEKLKDEIDVLLGNIDRRFEFLEKEIKFLSKEIERLNDRIYKGGNRISDYITQFIEHINDTLKKDILRFEDLLFTKKQYSLDDETYYEFFLLWCKLCDWSDSVRVFRKKMENYLKEMPLEDKILPLIQLNEKQAEKIESLEKEIKNLEDEIKFLSKEIERLNKK